MSPGMEGLLEPRDQRLMDLCAFIVHTVNGRRRTRITIVIDGDSFGIGGVEEVFNPRGNIEAASRGGRQNARPGRKTPGCH